MKLIKASPFFAILTIMTAFTSSTAIADYKLGDYNLAGTLGLGAQINSAHQKSAKLMEFEDLRQRLYGNAELSLLNEKNEKYSMDFSASRIGLKDQSYALTGGHLGVFKYKFEYDSLVHNYSFNASSFYRGDTIGTGVLTYDAPLRSENSDAFYTPTIPIDASQWTSKFDYSTVSRTYGGEATYNPDNVPYFVTMGFNKVKRTGIKPFSTQSGLISDRQWATTPTTNKAYTTSSMGYMLELPEPIDQTTNNANGTFGFKGDKWLVAVDGNLSKFTNETQNLVWRDPFVTTENFNQTIPLDPSNTYWKLGLQGNLRDLPMDSTLSLKGGYSKLTNSVTLSDQIAYWTLDANQSSPVYYNATLTPSRATFDGNVTYITSGLSFDSKPTDRLSSRVYYNFLRKYNKSSQVTWTITDPDATARIPSAASRVTTESELNELFHYYKHNAGTDFTYKFPFHTKMGAGLEYLGITRDRSDAEATTDWIAHYEIKNNSLDFLTGKIKYQYLARKSVFDNGASGTNANDATYLFRYLRAFDATDKRQHLVKIGFDLEPVENTGIGIEVAGRKSDYTQTVLGRTKDAGYDANMDVSYVCPDRFKVDLFSDVSFTRYLSSHRAFAGSTGNLADPTSGDFYTSSSLYGYNWSSEIHDFVWGYGLNFGIPLLDKKIDLSLGWRQDRSNGNLSYYANPAITTPLDVPWFDDYTKHTLKASARYNISANLTAGLGYRYEKMVYQDIGYDGYSNVLYTTQYKAASNTTTSSVPNTWLTGAYGDHDYTAHVGYVMAEYRL